MKSMKAIFSGLEKLKETLPFNCTEKNIQKLKIKFIEYKYLVGEISETFSPIKNQGKKMYDPVQEKLNEINAMPSFKNAKKPFREAAGLLQSQVKSPIVDLWLESTKM